MSLRSLELRWLARADKDILLPIVVFTNIPYAGTWECPIEQECLLNNKFYPLNRGLIVINDAYSDEEIGACLAHEWRHCWQFHQGWEEDYLRWDLNSPLSLEKQTVEYYVSNSLEFDALLFELNKSPCEDSKESYEWIIKSNEVSHV